MNGTFHSDTVPDPRNDCQGIAAITRSEKVLQEPKLNIDV